MAKLTMGRAVARWWKYLAAKLHLLHEDHADPKVQLHQAIAELHERHRTLTDQAAKVLGHQRRAQMRLDNAIAEHATADAAASQALLVADQAARAGDAAKSERLVASAELSATRVIALEDEIRGLEQALLTATTQAEQVKAAVLQNDAHLQRTVAEQEKLLSALEMAKAQEALNAAMRQTRETFSADAPTLAQVRAKIEDRLADAQGMAELLDSGSGIQYRARMLELEQEQTSLAAQARLAGYRERLGLTPAIEAGPAGTSPDESQTVVLRAVDE